MRHFIPTHWRNLMTLLSVIAILPKGLFIDNIALHMKLELAQAGVYKVPHPRASKDAETRAWFKSPAPVLAEKGVGLKWKFMVSWGRKSSGMQQRKGIGKIRSIEGKKWSRMLEMRILTPFFPTILKFGELHTFFSIAGVWLRPWGGVWSANEGLLFLLREAAKSFLI